ncbi:MAG: glycoside hydrolase family 130 protein [Bacteroides sp.]|jgi:predicted GH43/DUF377 family glycosyl hydrolase|nr:glycoside hydrolase family 130 protein [Bacteroides sp.]
MRLNVQRQKTIILPDKKRVIARYFFYGQERAEKLIEHVLNLPEKEIVCLLNQIQREFSKRHRSISGIFKRNYQGVKPIVEDKNHGKALSEERKLLIGSYFTMEYALESAALFNPSVVEDFDQSELQPGEKRYIVSLRATGEGHISSLVFRRAVIDANNQVRMIEPGDQIGEAESIKDRIYEKANFIAKLISMKIEPPILEDFLKELSDKFTYDEIRETVKSIQLNNENLTSEEKRALEEVLWLADSHTELRFSLDTDLSERVIFPISQFEKKGIEDARFTLFTKDSGEKVYYGTYTAYDGFTILPKLIETKDFLKFKISPLNGKYAIGKNMALFPRKINGRYAMLGRIDGFNNYLMYSDNLYLWNEAQLLTTPKYCWELVQMGNGGSPIETDRGWLMITHGVGPVRKYGLGACLLDRDDPSKVIGRLKEPLLLPDEDERSGYVPNVVYTCGAFIHNENLIIPYAMSDYASSFANVNLNALLDELQAD